ncbi:MAG: stalk domain-containing protein [Lachnospirales bacterium]
MKKFSILTLGATMLMSTLIFAESPAKPELGVVEGISLQSNITTLKIAEENTEEEALYVMARPYGEQLGYEITWDKNNKAVIFTKASNEFKATVGSKKYYSNINGSDPKIVELENSTIIVDNNAYIPEEFGTMLFEVPVVDPSKPTEDISKQENTDVNLNGERDMDKYETITPTMPALDTDSQPNGERDLDKYEPITPTVPTLDEFSEFNPSDNSVETTISKLTNEEVSPIISEQIITKLNDIYDTSNNSFSVNYKIILQNDDFVKVIIKKVYTDENNNITKVNDVEILLYDAKTGKSVEIKRGTR